MNQFSSNQKGFTLIELMVVVGIIAILAAVALPQYSKYQLKAKQTEVRIGLASLYTIEKSYFIEKNTYSSCIVDLGFGIEGATNIYGYGFTGGVEAFHGVPECTSGMESGAESIAEVDAECITAPSTFLACAAGILDVNNNPDHWTMDQDKTFANVKSGLVTATAEP